MHQTTRMLDILLVGSAIAAVAMLSTVLWRRPLAGAREMHTEASFVRNWQAYGDAGHRMSDAARPRARLVLFTDYECSYCGSLASKLRLLSSRYPEQLRIVVRQFPQPAKHRHSEAAAQAAVCAGRQGAFARFEQHLYAQRESLGRVPWEQLVAGVPGMRADSLMVCMSDPETHAQIARDLRAAAQLAFRASPALLLNDSLLIGDQAMDALEARLRAAMTRSVISQ